MEQSPSFKRELLATLPSLRAFAVSLSGRHDKADDLVQDDDDSAASAALQAGTQVQHLDLVRDVEIGRRLVQQQE